MGAIHSYSNNIDYILFLLFRNDLIFILSFQTINAYVYIQSYATNKNFHILLNNRISEN